MAQDMGDTQYSAGERVIMDRGDGEQMVQLVRPAVIGEETDGDEMHFVWVAESYDDDFIIVYEDEIVRRARREEV